MALSEKIKTQFEQRTGMTLNALSEAPDHNFYDTLTVAIPARVKHVSARVSVSSKQKDKENRDILRQW